MLNILAVVLTVASTFFAAFGSLFLKKGSKKFNLKFLDQIKNTHLILGVVIFPIGILIYTYALRYEKLSLLYPLTSITYVWVALISIKFLGEKMNKNKWIGIILIMLGISLVSFFYA